MLKKILSALILAGSICIGSECTNGELDKEIKKQQNIQKTIKQRLVGIVMDNNRKARYQSGISQAKITYLYPVERPGYRFLCIYDADNIKEGFYGPERSARIQAISLALPHLNKKGMLVHCGASKTGYSYLKELKKSGELKSYDEISRSKARDMFKRFMDENDNRSKNQYQEIRTQSHSLFLNLKGFVEKFTDEIKASDTYFNHKNMKAKGNDKDRYRVELYKQGWVKGKNINCRYAVEYEFDKEKNSYKVIMIDNDNLEEFKDIFDPDNPKDVYVDNIVAEYVEIEDIKDKLLHIAYDVYGEHDTTILRNGESIEGKVIREKDKVKYFYKNGDEIKFNNAYGNGNIWIHIVEEKSRNKNEMKKIN